MPKKLMPLTVAAPGFFGLNTQNASSVLPPGWCTKASNLVYDDAGRLASRNGTQHLNATAIASSPTIKSIHEYIDASGNVVNILAAGNKIYKEVSGTIGEVTGSITTPTGDDWQFVNFNGWCVGFQSGHAPIVSTSATSPVFADSGGTQYNGVAGLSAFGRLWTVYGNTLYYSDLLINNFTGGSSGSFDLSKYWPNGMDTATAVAEFNGLLLVFGQKSIILYENPDDVSNMGIIEGIEGIGCPHMDTIQAVGDDLVFLSNSGLRSLKRVLIEKSLPLTDLSQHVRDTLLSDVDSETAIDVKGVYNEREGFYLLSLPTTGLSYYFHIHTPNEDGTWKATTWDFAPDAMVYTQDKKFLVAATDGFISEYVGYKDAVISAGTGGSSFVIDYESIWNDFGEEVSYNVKILKNISVLGAGTPSSDVNFKWAVDYSDTFNSIPLAFNSTPPSQYGTAQYGVDSFAAVGTFERVKGHLSSAGQVIKYGITATIDGTSFGLQRLDVLVKIGRLAL